jgi:hypothetical protein
MTPRTGFSFVIGGFVFKELRIRRDLTENVINYTNELDLSKKRSRIDIKSVEYSAVNTSNDPILNNK